MYPIVQKVFKNQNNVTKLTKTLQSAQKLLRHDKIIINTPSLDIYTMINYFICQKCIYFALSPSISMVNG